MITPKTAQAKIQRVTDVVRNMVPFMRGRIDPIEQELAVHLRGNEALYESLRKLLQARIEARANLSVPSTPNDCMVSMAKDKELRWALSRLEFVYRSSVTQPTDSDSEQPA